MTEKILEINSLNLTIKKNHIIKNVSFALEQGKVYGLVGPNGAGKTSLIKSILNCYKTTSGNIKITNIPNTNPLSFKNIGYVPEHVSIPTDFNAISFLNFLGHVRGLSKIEAENKSKELLKRFKLWDYRTSKINNWSSGMQKKLIIAQALLTDPDILLLDEPTDNLDPTTRIDIMDFIKEFKNRNKTFLICSHVLSELQDIADTILLLNNGQMVLQKDLINFEKNVFHIEFISDEYYKLAKKILTGNLINETLIQNNEYIFVIKEYSLKDLNKLFFKNKIGTLVVENTRENLMDLYKATIK